MGLDGLAWKLIFALTSAPHLQVDRLSTIARNGSKQRADEVEMPEASIAVIVRAYNEEQNVVSCLASVLDNTSLSMQVVLADDGSTDDTAKLAEQLQEERGDDRLTIVQVPPRPEGERWVGKNWACACAVEHLANASEQMPDYLLFMDCDVTLEPQAIEAAIALARRKQVGLLTIAPEIVCGCLAEWLVQPIMMASMAGWFDPNAVNNNERSDAFAAGPFMLFEQSAYRAIGGHAGVKDCVVEDVELASKIKRNQLGLHFTYSGSLVKLRMYRDAA